MASRTSDPKARGVPTSKGLQARLREREDERSQEPREQVGELRARVDELAAGRSSRRGLCQALRAAILSFSY